MEIETCSVCGKSFIKAPQHMYKVKVKTLRNGKPSAKFIYQCKYSCYRAAGGDDGTPTKHRANSRR